MRHRPTSALGRPAAAWIRYALPAVVLLVVAVHPSPAFAVSGHAVIDAVNSERAARGLAALQPYSDTSQVSRANGHLATTNSFHGLAGEVGPWYLSNGATSFAENQAYRDTGSASATAFAKMWTGSPGHAKNQFNPEATHIAAAVTSAGGIVYATVHLLRIPKASTSSTPPPPPEAAPDPEPEPAAPPKKKAEPKAEPQATTTTPAPADPAPPNDDAAPEPPDEAPVVPDPEPRSEWPDVSQLDTELAARLEAMRGDGSGNGRNDGGANEGGNGVQPATTVPAQPRAEVSAAALELAEWSADTLSVLLTGGAPDDVEVLAVTLGSDADPWTRPAMAAFWLLAVAALAASAVAALLHRRVRSPARTCVPPTSVR